MIRLKYLILPALILIILSACSDTKTIIERETKPTSELITEVKEETAASFIIEEIIPKPSGYSVVKGKTEKGDSILGVLNSDFQWAVEPNIELLAVTDFSEGLIGVGIYDDRDVRADKTEGHNLLWGYMNEKGNWVVEPQYRTIGTYSEGLAFVQTIEEDRDDLANSRGIVINQNGEELFEVTPSKNNLSEIFNRHNEDGTPKEEYGEEKFFNNTMAYHYDGNSENMERHFLIDKDGKKYDVPKTTHDQYQSNPPYWNGYLHYQLDEITKEINIYNAKTKESNIIKPNAPYPSMNIAPFFKENNLYGTPDTLKDKNVYKIMNIDGDVLVQTDKSGVNSLFKIAHGDKWLIFEDTDSETKRYLYITLESPEGKIIPIGNNGKLAKYKDRYWEQGQEYAILKSSDGNVLLGEENKILLDNIKESYYISPIVEVEYREDNNSSNYSKGLVNLESGKFFKFSDWEFANNKNI